MSLKEENIVDFIKSSKESLGEVKKKIEEEAYKAMKKHEKACILNIFNQIYPQMTDKTCFSSDFLIKKNDDGTVQGKILGYYFYSKKENPAEVKFVKFLGRKSTSINSSPKLGADIYFIQDGWGAVLEKNNKIKKTVDKEKESLKFGRVSLSVDEYYSALANSEYVLGVKKNEIDLMFSKTIYGDIDRDLQVKLKSSWRR